MTWPDPLDPLSPWTFGLEVAAILAFVAVLAEIGADAARRTDRSWRETWVNLAIGVPGALLTQVAVLGVAVVAITAIGALVPGELGLAWWTWPLAILGADLCYYLGHRLEHRVRVLWAHHSVHHSSVDFDLSTSARIAWQDPFLTWAYVIPLAVLGFHPGQILIAYEVVLVYQVWVHTRRIGRLHPWFEAIFNTPSAHRVHHASNVRYLDKNFGGILMVWDHLFGTYAAEDPAEPVRYGLTKPLPSHNPVVVNFFETAAWLREVGRARTVAEAWWATFGPPDNHRS
jgi:sterol desaturase/sphingolipid hydroxylase (fatty acid hydroxylase superfamily)